MAYGAFLSLPVFVDCGHGVVKGPRVSILWDLDNKPPKASPYHAALHLKAAAQQFGEVVDMAAFANKHALLHIPRWAAQQHAGGCTICGAPCPSPLALRRHLRASHRHERQRLHLHAGYGLGFQLCRAGVCLHTVDHKPQAADRALKRHMKSCITRGVECICLVSDDSGFAHVLMGARAKGLFTVVMGNTLCLQKFADVWYPWDEIMHGKDVSHLSMHVSHFAPADDNATCNQHILEGGFTKDSELGDY